MSKIWHPEFGPSYTPMQMLDAGVMMDCYYFAACTDIPSKYKSHPKALKRGDEVDASKNKFGLKSRQSLKEWQKNGWIKTDKCGWLEWYIKYFEGRRLGEEDDWQIGRWKSFVARHQGQIKASCSLKDDKCHPKQRQGLLQWAWDSHDAYSDDKLSSNAKRLAKLTGATIEQKDKKSVAKESSAIQLSILKTW